MNRTLVTLAVIAAATAALLTNHLDADAWVALLVGACLPQPGPGVQE